jgi:hypothetical protein
LVAPGDSGADGDGGGGVTVVEAAACLRNAYDSGLKKSIEQPESATARTIPSDTANADATSA